MTRCEQLQNKIELCIGAYNRTDGFMRVIWGNMAQKLKNKLNSLTLNELRECV